MAKTKSFINLRKYLFYFDKLKILGVWAYHMCHWGWQRGLGLVTQVIWNTYNQFSRPKNILRQTTRSCSWCQRSFHVRWQCELAYWLRQMKWGNSLSSIFLHFSIVLTLPKSDYVLTQKSIQKWIARNLYYKTHTSPFLLKYHTICF